MGLVMHTCSLESRKLGPRADCWAQINEYRCSSEVKLLRLAAPKCKSGHTGPFSDMHQVDRTSNGIPTEWGKQSKFTVTRLAVISRTNFARSSTMVEFASLACSTPAL